MTRSSYLYRANISSPSNLVTLSNYHKYFSHASLGNICQPQTIFHTRVCLLVQDAATEWSLTFAATSGVSSVVPPKDGWSRTQYSDVTILTVESVHLRVQLQSIPGILMGSPDRIVAWNFLVQLISTTLEAA